MQGLIERLLYTQALESVRCIEQGVMIDAADIDYASVMGWGFAPYTGGPLTLIDTIGAASLSVDVMSLRRRSETALRCLPCSGSWA